MFRAELWLFTTLFALGVIGGMAYIMLNPATAPVPDARTNARTMGQQSVSPNVNDGMDLFRERPQIIDDENVSRSYVELINQGDRNLVVGNFQDATVRFNKAKKIVVKPSMSLIIRLAVCAENSGKPGLAEQHYDQVIKSADVDIHRSIALLGLTRVWQKLNKPANAQQELADLFLISENQASQPDELRAQAAYGLANLALAAVLADYHHDLSQPDGVVFEDVDPDMTRLLEMLNATEGEQPAAQTQSDPGSLPEGYTLVQRPNDSPNLVLLSAKKQTSSIKEHLGEMGMAGQFDIKLSAAAAASLDARSKSIHVRSQPMSLILDALLSPHGLCWIQEGNEIQIVAIEELPQPEQRKLVVTGVAERMFRHFTITFSGDYRFSAATLSMGNLQLLKNNLDLAANYYQVVAQSHPVDEIQSSLHFNLGKLNMMLGRDQAAIEQLFVAVDQTLDSVKKSAGYWLIGQISLEQDDLEKAAYAAGRALATAEQPKQIQLAALTLARTYLFANDPDSANQVLFNHRAAFKNSPLRSTVTILSNYSQYIGVEDQHGKDAAEQRLLTGLTGMADDHYLSFLDCYAAGRAYRELGFPEKAIEKLTLAVNSTNIPVWKNRILFALAVEKAKTGQEKDAAAIYDFLIREDSAEWGRPARLQVAELYLNNKMPEECLQVCTQLINLPVTEAERKKMLTMMGYAFRQLNKHHSSALCFAGLFPTDESGPNPR